MKYRQILGSGGRRKCTPHEQDRFPKKSGELYPEDPGGDYEWMRIQMKTMPQVLEEYDCFFDCHGNLCSEHGHLAPSYFNEMGHTFDVKVGCSFSLPETDWLVIERTLHKDVR